MYNTKDLLEKINKILALRDGHNFDHILLHIAEELGETSRASRDLRNGKGTKEELREEIIDVLVTSFAAYCMIGGTDPESFEQMFNKKCDKWVNQINKKQSATANTNSTTVYTSQRFPTEKDLENDAQYQQAVSEGVDDLVYSEFGVPK